MTAFVSDNLFPKVILEEVATDGSDITSPDADYRTLFLGEDGDLHLKDSSGTVTDVGGSTSDLAGKELDYVQITSPATITATTEATSQAVVTGSAVTYDGSTIIEIEFYSQYGEVEDASGASLIVLLYDGATVLGRLATITNVAAAALRVPLCLKRRITPSAASHTYSIKAYSTVATANAAISAGAGGTGAALPAFLRITRVSS